MSTKEVRKIIKNTGKYYGYNTSNGRNDVQVKLWKPGVWILVDFQYFPTFKVLTKIAHPTKNQILTRLGLTIEQVERVIINPRAHTNLGLYIQPIKWYNIYMKILCDDCALTDCDPITCDCADCHLDIIEPGDDDFEIEHTLNDE